MTYPLHSQNNSFISHIHSQSVSFIDHFHALYLSLTFKISLLHWPFHTWLYVLSRYFPYHSLLTAFNDHFHTLYHVSLAFTTSLLQHGRLLRASVSPGGRGIRERLWEKSLKITVKICYTEKNIWNWPWKCEIFEKTTPLSKSWRRFIDRFHTFPLHLQLASFFGHFHTFFHVSLTTFAIFIIHFTECEKQNCVSLVPTVGILSMLSHFTAYRSSGGLASTPASFPIRFITFPLHSQLASWNIVHALPFHSLPIIRWAGFHSCILPHTFYHLSFTFTISLIQWPFSYVLSPLFYSQLPMTIFHMFYLISHFHSQSALFYHFSLHIQ
jgi:hypothetical protein